MNKEKTLNRRSIRRAYRVRKKLHGTSERPRLTVSRSLKHIAVQVIDDVAAKTLVAISTNDKDVRGTIGYGGNKESAAAIGKMLAERALKAGITQVQFDRGSSRYHGRLTALADAAREAGLKF